MLEAIRARARRQRGRLAVVCAVALVAAAVGTAHTNVAADHMGEAAAVCLAIVAGGAAVAALPALAGPLPRRRAPLTLGGPRTPVRFEHARPQLARGDPAVLQVFRL